MPGRDRSRLWGAAEAGVTLLLEGITLRSDRLLVNDARKRAFAWRPGGARTCATTSVRRVVQVHAADDPIFSQLERHQIGGRTSSRLHHRSTRPGVTGPPARIPIFLPSTPIALSSSRRSERPSVSGAGWPFRPCPARSPIRPRKRESAKGPPRRPARADSPTPSVNEEARLDFEAGLELPDRNGFEL
jgi:hypothetical protein